MTHETKLLVSNIGYRLKRKRLHLLLRFKDVAIATGLHEGVIRRLETGSQSFQIDTVVPLMQFYGLSYQYLFCQYTTLPSLSQWRHLELVQKEQNRYHKSKQKLKPQTGVQLMLKF